MPDINGCLAAIDKAYQSLSSAGIEREIIRQLQLYADEHGENDRGYAALLHELGAYMRGLGRWQECEKHFRRGIEILEQLPEREGPDYAVALGNMSSLYRLTGRKEEALRLLQSSGEIIKRSIGEENEFYAAVLNNIGMLYQDMKSWEDALYWHLKAKHIVERLDDADMQAVTLCNLATPYNMLSQPEQAEASLREAIFLYENLIGTKTPHYQACLNNLGAMLCSCGRAAEGGEMLKKALSAIAALYGTEHYEYKATLKNIATLGLDIDVESEAAQGGK